MILPTLPATQEVRYQKLLAEFVVQHKLYNIVETGMGVSTLYLLAALDELGEGHLTSIDPQAWYPEPIVHPRHTLIKALSIDALPNVPGDWDLFLHDSDHDCNNQTFEFQYAWFRVRKDGWIAADDHTWGGHGAWNRFISEPTPLPVVTLDSVQLVRKTEEAAPPALLPMYLEMCVTMADCAEKRFLESGGKNSDAFAKYRRQ